MLTIGRDDHTQYEEDSHAAVNLTPHLSHELNHNSYHLQFAGSKNNAAIKW
jgi:hypothetical protein